MTSLAKPSTGQKMDAKLFQNTISGMENVHHFERQAD